LSYELRNISADFKNNIQFERIYGEQVKEGDTITQTGKLNDEVQVKNETEINQTWWDKNVGRQGSDKEGRTGRNPI
jgi:hypothetical protein